MRRDPVTGNYVIIASERSKRPNDFSRAGESTKTETCFFCYGNENKTPPEVLALRPNGGKKDSPGWIVRAFPNKFPAVTREGSAVSQNIDEQVIPATGIHEVVIDTPNHSETLGSVSDTQAESVMLALVNRYNVLYRDSRVGYVQIFKNSGAKAGASIEHSHWQIITVPLIPAAFTEEFAGALRQREQTGVCVYCQMSSVEEGRSRVVEKTDGFIAITPFAPRFPYEMWILPCQHQAGFGEMTEQQIRSLGRVLRRTLKRLEQGFDNPPYNIILHSAPPIKDYETYHWHMEIIPRLTTTAGFEWGSGIFINPTSPELAAETLREIDPDICDK